MCRGDPSQAAVLARVKLNATRKPTRQGPPPALPRKKLWPYERQAQRRPTPRLPHHHPRVLGMGRGRDPGFAGSSLPSSVSVAWSWLRVWWGVAAQLTHSHSLLSLSHCSDGTFQNIYHGANDNRRLRGDLNKLQTKWNGIHTTIKTAKGAVAKVAHDVLRGEFVPSFLPSLPPCMTYHVRTKSKPHPFSLV